MTQLMNEINLWIVEDNSLYAKALELAILEMDKVTCKHLFQTAEDALELITSDVELDLLLLDIELPGMNGLKAIQSFLAVKPNLKIIVLTQHSEIEYVLEAITQGAVGYCLKSSSYDQLSDYIKTVMKEDAVIDPRLTKALMESIKSSQSQSSEFDLTDREQEVLDFLVKGYTKKMIGEEIHISYHTVDKHIRTLYKKLDVNNVSSAVAKALKYNLVKG